MKRTKIDPETDPFLIELRDKLSNTTIEGAEFILWELQQYAYANAAYKFSTVQERMLRYRLYLNDQTLSRKHERYAIYTDDWSRKCLAEKLTIDQVVEYVEKIRPIALNQDAIKATFG
jgi:hypothetical protein